MRKPQKEMILDDSDLMDFVEKASAEDRARGITEPPPLDVKQLAKEWKTRKKLDKETEERNRKMYSLRIEKAIWSALSPLLPKHFKQLVLKTFALQEAPRPHDCKKIGTAYRVDSGEYRILYAIDDARQLVTIWLEGFFNLPKV